MPEYPIHYRCLSCKSVLSPRVTCARCAGLVCACNRAKQPEAEACPRCLTVADRRVLRIARRI